MQLYEISGSGYHTPLSGGEIAKLFRAGRLHREVKCKAVDAQRWRTVDELFPLLKYNSSGDAGYTASEEPNAVVTARHILVAVAATAAVASAAFAVFLLYQRSAAPAPERQTARAIAPPVRDRPDLNRAPRMAAPNSGASLPHVPPAAPSPPAVVQVPRGQPFTPESDRRFAEERRRREQEQHDQAIIAQRIRDQNAREAAQRQRDAGIDTIIPLDSDAVVNVGGISVGVRVHDHDVTSFDVRINGGWKRNFTKNKGVSGSRSDETLIYGNGAASLYYVWEISGKLNHCRLRVRQN